MPKGSGSPKRVNTVKKGLRQFKRKRQKGTQETEERAHPSQVSSDPARKRREKLSDFSQCKWVTPRGTRMKKYKKKGVVAKDFQTGRVGFRPFEKKDKDEGRLKAGP